MPAQKQFSRGLTEMNADKTIRPVGPLLCASQRSYVLFPVKFFASSAGSMWGRLSACGGLLTRPSDLSAGAAGGNIRSHMRPTVRLHASEDRPRFRCQRRRRIKLEGPPRRRPGRVNNPPQADSLPHGARP